MRYDRNKNDAIFVSPRHKRRSWKAILIALIAVFAILAMVHGHHVRQDTQAATRAHQNQARMLRGYSVNSVQSNLNKAIYQYNHDKLATANLKKAHYKAVRIANPKLRAKMVYKTYTLTKYMRSNG